MCVCVCVCVSSDCSCAYSSDPGATGVLVSAISALPTQSWSLPNVARAFAVLAERYGRAESASARWPQSSAGDEYERIILCSCPLSSSTARLCSRWRHSSNSERASSIWQYAKSLTLFALDVLRIFPQISQGPPCETPKRALNKFWLIYPRFLNSFEKGGLLLMYSLHDAQCLLSKECSLLLCKFQQVLYNDNLQ